MVILLGAVTLAVYASLLRSDFTRYDDDRYITRNSNVQRGLTWKGFLWTFNIGYASNWHPLTWLSHMLDVELFGLRPAGHHATSLVFHLVNVLLLFFFLKRISGRLWESAFVAALFAVHPLHVESVAWIAERKDVLSTTLGLLTLWTYAAYVGSPSPRRYASLIGLFALGLMAKPMLVTLPFVLLLLDYWPLRRFQAQKIKSRRWPGWRLIWEKIPLFILAAASCVATTIAQQKGGALSPQELLPLGVRVANALTSYGRYILLTVWPAKLAVLYPHPGAGLPIWQPVVSALALISLTYALIRVRRKFPYLIMGWLWYLGTLVPVIGLVQVGSQAMADRYTYLPLVGLFVAATWGVRDLTVKTLKKPEKRIAVLAGLLIIVLAARARVQAGTWRNTETLFRQAIAVTKGNSIAHNSLGEALLLKGELDEAIVHFREALRIDPGYAFAHFNLAHAFSLRGNWEEAVPHYQKGLEIRPQDVAALSELGIAFSKLGNWEEAMACFQEALRIKPDDPNNRYRLALAFIGGQDYESAVEQFSEVLRIKPDWPEAHHNMSVALLELGRTEEAIRHSRAALNLRPDYGLAHGELAAALFASGDYAGAWDEVRLARQYGSPPSPEFLQQLSLKMPEPHWK
jgi:tetratricopeptide (TPR) repeat protein